jgi:hypothetical protein
MQQPPNLYSQDTEQQDQQPLQHRTRKKPPKKKLWNLLWLLVIPVFVIAFILGLASRGQNQQPATTTTQPTAQPTPRTIIPTRSQIDTLLISKEPDVTIASYIQQSATLVLQESFSHIVPISQNEIKQNLQEIQVKVWQQGWNFSQVTVNILQAQDNGQNKIIGYGVITRKTASNINWTFEHDLWDKYDQKYLDPSLPNY